MRAPHSSTPAAFQSESPHQECVGHGKASQSKPRNWKNRLLLQPPELGDDSDLSSSSGSIVPYVHPTEGKTHLSIKDTEDYLTVQNPNPHTGRMSPAFSSIVTERPEPITLRGAKDANHGPRKFEGHSLDNEQRLRDRWPDFWRPLRKVSTLKRKPPAPYVEDEVEEPPDGLSDISPLQTQPCPTHFAAFDPDHLRIPGALRVSPPPPKTTTNEGTDAIATWVTTGSRRIYELPASSAALEMELPSVPQHEPSSRHVRFSDDCAVSYPCYNPPSPPMHHQLPSPPPGSVFASPIPKFAKIEITRKPLSRGCEEDAPPVPPKHEYIPKTWNQSTQTRASIVSSRSHTIEPVYKSDAVLAQKTPTRLNGTGVPRLVVTTSKKVDQEKEKEKRVSIEKDKEKEKIKHKKREKGYRREKELLPASASPNDKKTSSEKAKTDEAADQPPKPKSRSKSTVTAAREPASTSASASADRSATLKAALDRITAAKAKRHSSAPIQAATAPAAATATTEPARARSSAAKIVPPNSRPTSTTAKFLATAAATAAASALSTSKTAAAAAKETEAKAKAGPDVSQTTTASSPSPVLSLTITRENALLVGKLFLGLWGLLAAFYLLGALGRALWVILAPIRLIFSGVGRLGGCVRGAGW
ncbi:hypothetical protein IWZ01DRAFT_484798 [Phyllosticta capitalensis]